MTCAFFCDTGVIYGRCYPKDFHHEDCKAFFSKYPISTNDYFIPCIVIEELENHKIKLDKSKKVNRQQRSYVRTFQQCIDRRIDGMEIFDLDSHEEHEETYEKLLSKFDIILDADTPNKENDSEIVAHAVIWSFIVDHEKRTLITVDGLDLVNHADELIEIAEQIFANNIELKIKYLKSLC